MLDAGATINGKARCGYFGFSGGSNTGALVSVSNLRKSGYSAGGSSSGRGAQVAAGEVDWLSAAIRAARSVCRRRLILCCRIWPLGHRHRTTACAIHRNQPPPRGIRGKLIPCRRPC
jgi:Amidase